MGCFNSNYNGAEMETAIQYPIQDPTAKKSTVESRSARGAIANLGAVDGQTY